MALLELGVYFPGDFFKDALPEADLYILARILHDWSDQRCIQLLRRVHQAGRPGQCVCAFDLWPRWVIYPAHSAPKSSLLERTTYCLPYCSWREQCLTLIKDKWRQQMVLWGRKRSCCFLLPVCAWTALGVGLCCVFRHTVHTNPQVSESLTNLSNWSIKGSCCDKSHWWNELKITIIIISLEALKLHHLCCHHEAF